MQHGGKEWMQTLTGAQIKIKVSGAATDNRLTIIDFIEPAHSKPPVFTRHEFVEVFNVVSGTLWFQFLHESAKQLNAGQSVVCPGFKPHSFWNQSDQPVQVQLVCSPAGLDQFFIESNALLNSPDIPAIEMDARRLALRTKYGLEHVGVPPTVSDE